MSKNFWVPKSVLSYLVMRIFSFPNPSSRKAESQESQSCSHWSQHYNAWRLSFVYGMQDWTQDGKDLILHAYVHLKEESREIILCFHVCAACSESHFTQGAQEWTRCLYFSKTLQRLGQKKKKKKWAQTNLLKSKKPRWSTNQVKGGS